MTETVLNVPAERVPRHIAVIMDGNGRWAKKRGLPRLLGHRQGTENLRRIIKACVRAGVRYLTIYAFSTENWGRPQDELKGLMQIFNDAFVNEISELVREGVRILHIGQREGIPADLLNKIDQAVERSEDNGRLILSVGLNYGGRNEIMHAVRKIVASGVAPEEVTESLISENLFTAGTPDPDLVIRTSGEYRISNFLLWQSAYAEWDFPETLWPDFGVEELYASIERYAKRDRRFGKLSANDG
ncbi:di-trans,poly-cis-decaprenylcistransferase [Anaerolineaceae bacterium oral taxon 439]|nr:di-trans,poly-cis-decaprenylcistransferase [Anaerolineaceae bacterium oral taxon 439]